MSIALILGWVALGLSWLLPTHFHPWLTFQQEFAAGVGAAFIGCAALIADADEKVRWPRFALFTLLLACIPIAQFTAGLLRFRSDAILATLYLVAFALCMVAGASLARARRNELVGGLFGVLLAAGIVSSGIALAQWLQLGPIGYVTDLPPHGRPFANLAQPNHLAGLLVLAMVATLAFHETRRIGPGVAAASVAWLGVALVATQSRAGWVMVTAVAVGTVLIRRRAALRTTAAAIAAAYLGFLAVIASWSWLSDVLMVSAQTFAERAKPGPRWMLWQALSDALLASPWVGYGWTQVGVATQVAAADHVMQRGLLNQSHNVLLDLMLWNGIPLGVLIFAAVCWWALCAVLRCRDAQRWAMLAAVLAVFLHELVEFPLEYAYFLVPIGLLIGALDTVQSKRPPLELPKVTLAAPLAAATAMMLWVGVEYVRVEAAARELRFVIAGIGVDKVPTAPPPDVLLLDAPREIHKFWLITPRPGMSAEELDWMRRVQERYAVPSFQVRYAVAAAMNGRVDETNAALIRMCHMYRPSWCQQWHAVWRQLQTEHPALSSVPFPERVRNIVNFESR